MRCLWLEKQRLTVRDIPRPEPAPGEALIRVLLAGICATDLELTHGYYPFTGIPGHEFTGRVVSAPNDPVWEGKRVVGEINLACGACAACQAGRSQHCPNRGVLGIVDRPGVFAEFVCLPVANLHEIPPGLDDSAAAFTEPLAAALRIGQQIRFRPRERVLVIGAGRLGQLIARVLALEPVDLVVVARHPRQRQLLEEQGVAVLTEDEIEPQRADVVIDASGTGDGFALARRALRPQGQLVLKSTYAGSLQVDLSSLVVDEVTLVGSRCGPFPAALELLAQGRLDPQALIEARYPLTAGPAAFAHAARPGALKILLEPGDTP